MSETDGARAEGTQRLLRETYFENETFTNLDLQNAELADKEFYRCTFENCQLQESRWKDSILEACVVRGCNVTRAQFGRIALREVRFEGSKLIGIDWSNIASNPEFSFVDSGLSYCSFVGLSMRKMEFLRCVAREVNFYDLDLTDSDFKGTDLSGSNFRGCTLTRTDFSETQGAFLDPAHNRLKDTRVPLDSVVNLAKTLGMRVAGYHDEVSTKAKKKAR
ncbi:pentapeptide repeat-containing protein [Myxococcus sp. CA051A]|uniref:pentapeptide repeat-containing protein n=1 Tax=Myxococcus sp. CA051A TaxID=2741739 RepID=UPI00157A82A7|nr:pentapeptide repeat-containing protein [Myxococcus sp. CA051A]